MMRAHIREKSTIMQRGAQRPIYCSTSAKTKELIVDFRKKGGKDTDPVYISEAEVDPEGINIKVNLS